jgi:hypothetical protein
LQPTPASSSGSGAGSSAFAATDPRRLDGASGSDSGNDGYNGDGSDASETERTPLGEQTTETGDRTSGDQYADGEGGAGYDDYSEAARMEQAGDTGAIVAPGLDQMDTDQGSGEFDAVDEDPANNVSPAESDGGVESNGETVGFGDGDAVPPSGRITEAQRAEINQNRDNGFDVELNPVNTNPQIIARDW